jgi:putative ABC transport system permease protein
MLKNYFKIAWRTIVKDKSFTAINLLGLASGLAITLMIVQYVRFELSYEDNYPKKDQIVRLTTDIISGESVVSQDCETNPPLARLILDRISEVTNATRVYPIGEPAVDIEINQKQYIVEKVFAVDSSFFDIFSVTLLVGKKEGIMTGEREVVLSEATALKYFNSTDVLGKTINFIGDGSKLILKVTGVAPTSPSNTHLKFDMLISYPTMLADFGEKEDNWNGNNTLTYIELAPKASYENFTQNLIKFNEGLVKQDLISDERFVGQKIADIHLYSKKGFETEPNGEAKSVYLLLGVAFLVIISALVNYVNLTTSKVLDRAKEIGMRKVVGSTQSQIRTQVFIDSFLMNLAAGGLATVIIALVKPLFVETAGLPVNFSVFSDLFFWQSLALFLTLSIFLSAIYPAFILSSFKPTAVLKGKFTHSSTGTFLRKSLVVFQFTITVVLLVQAFAVHNQLKFLRNVDLGVDTKQTLVVRTPSGSDVSDNFEVFKQSLKSQAMVKSVSTSTAVPGSPQAAFSTTTGVNLSNTQEETNFNYNLTQIDTAYFALMDIKLLAGENYTSSSIRGFGDAGDKKRQVIVNEEAIRIWGIPTAQEAIGQEVSFFGTQWNIKGVVKNYSQFSPKSPQLPIIHVYTSLAQEHISVKFQSGKADEQLALVKSQFEASFEGKPFQYFFLDTEYDQQYKAEESFQKVFGALTLFAIFIACLGLFGLATFTVVKRTKEIGIRKSIGASTTNVLMLLSKDFIKTVLISMLVGIPTAYFLVQSWLQSFANHIEISWWLFALPSVLIMVLVIISISSKTISTALMNPVDSLKSE